MIAKARMRVLLVEGIDRTARECFEAAGFEVTVVANACEERDLVALLPGVHLLGVRSRTRVTEAIIARANSLLAIGCFCVGTNNVDLEAAGGHGIPVFNAPFSNTRSVAELVIGEIIALARNLGDRSREVHAGTWRKSAAGSYEVRGRTLGVVGYGNIGSQLGSLAEAIGMRVVFYDVAAKLPLGNCRAAGSLDEVLAECDFLSLHVPETPETRGMIGATQLARMKQRSYLINASRGDVVDLDALAKALREGRLAGAAVDVFPREPETNGERCFTSPLQGIPNVVLTPHVGGSTVEAQAAIGREVATTLDAFVATGSTRGAVNFPRIDLGPAAGDAGRVLNVHRNLPSALRDINRTLHLAHADVRGRTLSTDRNLGYLVLDVDRAAANDVGDAVRALAASVRTRVLG